MILQRLAEHYSRIAASGDDDSQLAPLGFSRQKISFCVVLERDGRLNEIQSTQRRKGRALIATPMILPGHEKPSGQGINPSFLWDNASYMLGWASGADKLKRAASCFEAFRKRHLDLEAQISHPAFKAVCSFLRSWSPNRLVEFDEGLSRVVTNFGVFRLSGEMQYVHELVLLSEVKEGPEDSSESENTSEAMDKTGQCLVTGVNAQIARVHEPKVKGVAGAKTSGALVVSFNAASYESYGKSQSFNAPVSKDAVFRYANALNNLLNRSPRRFSLGDSTVIFEGYLSDFFADLLPRDEMVTEEELERVRRARVLFAALRDGTREETTDTDDGDQTKFFLLGLSPNASRISVRLWLEADVTVLKQRLGQHLRDISLDGNLNDEFLTLWRIITASGRWDSKKARFDADSVPPKFAGDLTRSVLTGLAYPQPLLATMLRRIHTDGQVKYARAAAIKACLVRNARLRGNPLEVPKMLDSENTDPAYCCGRAFALLEAIQRESAGKGITRTIKDGYFSSASTTPSLVFPRLCRLSQHHLANLATGRRIHREKQLGEVLDKLTAFPRRLSLEDQGKFVLGYFQQTRYIYISKLDKQDEDEGPNQ